MESWKTNEPKCSVSIFKKRKKSLFLLQTWPRFSKDLFIPVSHLALALPELFLLWGWSPWNGGCGWESKGALLLFCWLFIKISNSHIKNIIGFPSVLFGGKGSSLQHWEFPQCYSNWDYLRREAAILLSPNFCDVLRPDKHKESSKVRIFLLLSKIIITIFKPLKFEEGMWSSRRECGKGQDRAASFRGDL